MSLTHLATALLPRSRQAILGLLYGHPDETYYLRQIASATGVGLGQCQRELQRLSDAGVLRRFQHGRHVYFQAAPDCPIYDELRGIVTKTIGVVSVLADTLDRFADDIAVAFVFGSVARGEERSPSDVDLLVVGDVTFSDIVNSLSNAETTLRRAINPTVYPPDEFAKKLSADSHFLKSVLKGEKIFIFGNDDELGKLAPQFVD
jgi:predicted nucleotidyltransferase